MPEANVGHIVDALSAPITQLGHRELLWLKKMGNCLTYTSTNL